MKGSQKVIIILFIILLIGGVSGYFLKSLQRSEIKNLSKSELELNLPKNMKLTSPVFENNQFIPAKYTCDGEDVNPPLSISEIPEEAKSLVLIIDDPDAPGGTWDHWVVWNISPLISQIKENELPAGAVEGLNDFKRHSYGGPCPPSGVHHYHFKLYALSKELEINPFSKKEDVERAMDGSILDQAELIGLYQRK